ncbi:MAG: putative transporter [Bacteroidales bacterium]|jgi:putative transport protein|nr:putative transporter [Bacteroidales bacterium]
MDWISDLLFKETVAHTIFIYCIVIALGVFLGKIKIFGVSLGIAFVLFTGIALGHFGFSANHEVVDFIRDFGLILFVFSIGLQVGPGFFSSFKKGGFTLNLLAMIIVLLGGLTVVVLHFITGTSVPMLVGVMSGAVTNTPGLGAAQQALIQVSEGAEVPRISIGYAVAYPLGVLGIIITMLIIRKALNINIRQEQTMYNQDKHPVEQMPEKASIVVTNRRVFGETIREITSGINHSFVISRVLHNGDLIPAGSDTIIYENDIILVVAQKGVLPSIVAQIGIISKMDLTAKSGKLISRRILVTNKDVFGKKLGSLKLRSRYNINITRVYRSGIELLASPELRLQMGDKLTVVGDEESIEKVINELGNSIKRLDEPNLIPIFLGILLGVLLGSIPFRIPGIVNPVKLGLAGGPLIVAILLSKYGYKFQLVSYTTPSANLMLREIGIVLFLASVGISAGEKFIQTLVSGDGFVWMGYGAIITLLPLLLVGFFSRLILKRNYLEICGLLSGSMTDPPALAFANSIARSEAPAVAYATIYPLVMFLRIFVAQLLILLMV